MLEHHLLLPYVVEPGRPGLLSLVLPPCQGETVTGRDAAERPLPRRTGDLDELRRVQRGLVAVRAREARRTTTTETRLSPVSLLAVALVPTVVIVVLTAVLARRSAGEAGPRELPVALAVVLLLALGLALLVRRDLRRHRWTTNGRARQQFHRLLARNAELWQQLAPEPAADLPLPPDRQPVLLAGLWHRRSGRGPDPDASLRAIPADAPPWRVRYHRYGGGAGLRLAVKVSAIALVGGTALILSWPF